MQLQSTDAVNLRRELCIWVRTVEKTVYRLAQLNLESLVFLYNRNRWPFWRPTTRSMRK